MRYSRFRSLLVPNSRFWFSSTPGLGLSIDVSPSRYAEKMDPTLAALIGTLCGAAITAVVPIALYRGNKRETELSRRREETAALLEVLLRLMDTRVQG